MKLKKPDIETIKRGAVEVGKMMGFVLFAAICKQIAGPVSIDIQPVQNRKAYPYYEELPSYCCRYGEAVRAVSNSDMFSSHKREAISAIEQYQSPDYYRAIMKTANSDMFSSDKKSTIIAMSQKAREENNGI